MSVICSKKLEIGRSEIKVNGPINAVTENQSYFWNRKTYKLQTWYMDEGQWPTSPTCVVPSKLKVLGGCSSLTTCRGRGLYCGCPPHYRPHSLFDSSCWHWQRW